VSISKGRIKYELNYWKKWKIGWVFTWNPYCKLGRKIQWKI